jgi:hypothetical protein
MPLVIDMQDVCVARKKSDIPNERKMMKTQYVSGISITCNSNLVDISINICIRP